MPQIVVIARDPLIANEAVARCLPAGCTPERHHVADLDLNVMFSQLGTADLFATRRAYHYMNFLGLNLGKKQQERLKELLSRLIPEITLVCSQVVQYEKRADENRILSGQLYKCWSANAKIVDERNTGDGAKAGNWLAARARDRYQLKLTEHQVQNLANACQDKPALIDAELRKLWMLRDGDQLQPISDSQLQSVLSTNPGARFYEMVDALMAGTRNWLDLLSQWHDIEADVHRLVNELKRRLLGMLDLHRGVPVQPPFIAQQLRRNLHQWPLPRLSRAIQGLAALEHALKSGGTTGLSSKAGDYSALQLYLAEILG